MMLLCYLQHFGLNSFDYDMLIAFVDYQFYLKIDNNLISFANINFGI